MLHSKEWKTCGTCKTLNLFKAETLLIYSSFEKKKVLINDTNIVIECFIFSDFKILQHLILLDLSLELVSFDSLFGNLYVYFLCGYFYS